MNIAKYINEACIAAVEECPQFEGFDDDTNENEFFVARLDKFGVETVINYWRSKETIGGHLLWEKGYCNALPVDIQTMFSNVNTVISKAIRDYLNNFNKI